jgi:hypothetical protein
MKVMTLFLYYGNNDVRNLRGPSDILGVSLFPILCSSLVHHNPVSLVVLTISGDQYSCYSSSLCLILLSFAEDHIFCIRLFLQKFTLVVDPVAFMHMFCLCTPEYVIREFFMS